jgi:hypothetical protein
MGLFSKKPAGLTVEASERFALAGTSQYQGSIARAVKGVRPRQEAGSGDEVWDVRLQVVAEPNNPYDKKAVAVLNGSRVVGYIPRQHTGAMRAALKQAGRVEVYVDALVLQYSSGDLGVVIPGPSE